MDVHVDASAIRASEHSAVAVSALHYARKRKTFNYLNYATRTMPQELQAGTYATKSVSCRLSVFLFCCSSCCCWCCGRCCHCNNVSNIVAHRQLLVYRFHVTKVPQVKRMSTQTHPCTPHNPHIQCIPFHTIPYHAVPISFLQLYTTHIIHSYHQCSRNGGDIVRWMMAPTYRAYRQHNHCVNVTSSHPIASPSGSWGVSKRDCVLPSFIYWEYCTLVGYSSSKEVTTEAWSDSLLMHLKKFRYLLSY